MSKQENREYLKALAVLLISMSIGVGMLLHNF